MILRVGPFLYRVHFVEDELTHEGERCLGLCDNETHDIYIAATTSFAQQIQIICHEYMEAWLYHFGHPAQDKEAYCDLFGMAMTQFVMDLLHQLDHFAREPGQTGQTSQPAPEAWEETAAASRARPDRERISETPAERSRPAHQARVAASDSPSPFKARDAASACFPRSGSPACDTNSRQRAIATKLAEAARTAGLRVRSPDRPRRAAGGG